MKNILLAILLAILFSSGCTNTSVITQKESLDSDSKSNQTLIERIVLNPMETADQGVAVTWRTPVHVSENFVQWGIAQPNPVSEANRGKFQQKQALGRTDTVSYEEKTSVFKSFRVELSDLHPGKKYMYRVGNEAKWSEWIQFDLPEAAPDSAFTFIYLGDAQNDIASQWSRTIREAYADAPDASFIMYAGDLVNRGYRDSEWGEWFKGGGFIHRMIPSIMTPGNHEYDDLDLTPLWHTHFSLPKNGPAGYDRFKNAAYYVDYPAVRIISLDGTTSEDVDNLGNVQAEWLENVLKQNDKKWTIVTLHQPFYSTKESRDNPKIREAFQSLLDTYDVDIVLQGHDHAYGRGMLDKQTHQPANSGTMYVVSVSGPKMYEIGNNKSWMQKNLADTQLYHIVTIQGDELYFKSYTASGELIDQFTLSKSSGNTIMKN